MKEAAFRAEIVKSLRYYIKDSFIQSLPSMYIAGGMLDIFGCINGGKFLAIETKLVRKLPAKEDACVLNYGFTKIQRVRASEIMDAGGIVLGLICIRPLMKVIIVSDVDIYEDFNILKKDLLEYPFITKDKQTGLWKINDIKNL